MLSLRLEKEWDSKTKAQQAAILAGSIDPEETINLLTRNKKLYEAKTLVQRLLKMIVQRNGMVEEAVRLDLPNTVGGTFENIPINKP